MVTRTLPNFVDTEPAPNLYRLMDEFATPTTDYEAALQDVRGAVKDLQASSGGAGQLVNVLAFGLTGDGSDQTAGFQALGTFLRAHPGCIVPFPGGDYLYSDNKWMVGVQSVRILGAGARFKCTGALSAGDGNTVGLWVNNGYWTTDIPYPTSGWIYDGARKFATVSGGATEVVCLTAAEAGDFQAGDIALLHGLEIYPTGWPPSCRFTEIVEVASANASTGAVGLVRPIRYNYDQRWRDNGTTAGAPRIMRLSRRAGWTLAEDIYIEGVTFLRGTEEPSYMSPYTYGGVYAIGARKITMVRCKIGNLNPSCCERFLAQDCEIDALEVDKFDDHVHFERCVIQQATGGTGSNKLSFRDSQVIDLLSLSANEVDIDGCDVFANDPVTHYALITAQSHTATLTRNRLHRRASDAAAPLHAYNITDSDVAITPAAVGSGFLKCALNLSNYQPLISAFVGARIFTKVAPVVSGTISAVYWDGTYLVIEADFDRDPLVTDTFYVNRTKHVSLWGNSELDRGDLGGLPDLPFPYRVDLLRWDELEGQGRMGRMVVPLPRRVDNPNNFFVLPGYPYRLVVDVEEAVSGYKLGIYPTGGTFWSRAIDCAYAGARSMDYFGTAGAQGTDGLDVLLNEHVVYSQINYYWQNTPGTRPWPKGVMIWEYICPPGARVAP